MYRENLVILSDETDCFALIENLKQKQIEKRVLAYIKKVIRNSPHGYCCVRQEVIRKALGVRKQAVSDACRSIVERGELIRIPANNKNRDNPKYYYFLPDAELSGNSIKSSFSNNGKRLNEDLVVPDKKNKTEKKEAERLEAARTDLAPDFLDVGSWNDLGKIAVIEKYLDAGLNITPLIEGGKIPPKGWSKEHLRSLSKNELLDYFRQNPQANVGCWLPENFVVVDADDLDELYQLTNGEVWETLTATSGRNGGGLHLWFRHFGTIGSGVGIRPDLDYKAGGNLIVLPPSVHESGTEYRWSNLAEPIDAPPLIQELYNTREVSEKAADCAGFGTARRGSRAILTAGTILKEKQRYVKLFPIGRGLRFHSNEIELATELHRLNRLHCQPPLNEKRMQKLISDVLLGKNKKGFRSHRVIKDGAMSN